MLRLEDYLCVHARQMPEKVAVVCGEEKLTYGDLWRKVDLLVHGMEVRKAGGGKALVFRSSQSTDFLATYFAAHCAGLPIVPLGKELPEERFREIKDKVDRAVIPDGTVDILFTTGTTGKEKGVMLSGQAIAANAENLVDAQGFAPDLTFIIAGPLNHIGSLSKVWAVVLAGGTVCITEGMKDVNAFFAAMDSGGGKVATFLVPAALRMLLALESRRLERYARIVDFIETGAAPMAQSDMELLCRVLPHTRLYNTYASTETGIICTHDYNAGKCVAGCLGRPMKHSEVFIQPDGTVACAGMTLMTGYVDEPELTAAVLHDGMLFTHDNGAVDSDGMLRLTGRTDDVVNVGGFKVAPTEVEGVALSFPGVEDCVCVPVRHPVMGYVLKLLVVLAGGGGLDKRALACYLNARLETYKVPLLYEAVDAVRRTYNGKIDRKSYQEKVVTD